MHINWFTVIAQIINFLILVWLLKRFLYKPILNAIDEREKKITARLKDADSKKAEAEQEQEEYRQKNDELSQHREELMNKAITETNEERRKLLEAARNDAAEARKKLEQSIEEIRQNMNMEIERKIEGEVFEVARKVLADLAAVNVEEQTVYVFIKRLNEMTAEEKKQFLSAFTPGANPVVVRSVFDLSDEQKNKIQEAVKEILGVAAEFQFSTAPELISGIELTTSGYKLVWSVAEYLHSLEDDITAVAKDNSQNFVQK